MKQNGQRNLNPVEIVKCTKHKVKTPLITSSSVYTHGQLSIPSLRSR